MTQHPPHPAPAQETVWRCCEFLPRAIDRKPEDCEMVKQKARQAREDFANELKTDIQTRFISSTNSWSQGRNSGLIECCNIIDEHRSTQHPGQEG